MLAAWRQGWPLAFTFPAAAKVLATVDGATITDDDVALATEDLGPTMPEQLDEAGRETYVLNYLIDLKLVAKKAMADKLESDPDFAREMAYYHDKVLMQDLLGKVAKDATSDAAVKKVYDEAAKAQPPQPEIHARHILVPTEEEAKAALARVKGGERLRQGRRRIIEGPPAPRGATSAGSPRIRWCRNSPMPPSN